MKKTSTNLPRYSFCRKFREDLWGSMLVSPKESNIPLLASLLRRHRRIKRSLRLILPPGNPSREGEKLRLPFSNVSSSNGGKFSFSMLSIVVIE